VDPARLIPMTSDATTGLKSRVRWLLDDLRIPVRP